MRRTLIRIVAALTGLAAMSCAPVLSAPPHLVAASPVDGVSLPVERQTFDLMFNRRLSASATWISVWRGGDGAPPGRGTAVGAAETRAPPGRPVAAAAGAAPPRRHR